MVFEFERRRRVRHVAAMEQSVDRRSRVTTFYEVHQAAGQIIVPSGRVCRTDHCRDDNVVVVGHLVVHVGDGVIGVRFVDAPRSKLRNEVPRDKLSGFRSSMGRKCKSVADVHQLEVDVRLQNK